MGPYFVSVQADAAQGFFTVKLDIGGLSLDQQQEITLFVDPAVRDPRFELINAAGESVQTLNLTPDFESPGRFQGVFAPQVKNFRIAVEDRDENSNASIASTPDCLKPRWTCGSLPRFGRICYPRLLGSDSPESSLKTLEVGHVRSFQMGDDQA